MTKPKPILSVKELTTRLHIGGQDLTVVEDVSFDLHAGKTLAVVGESGCGKSMTALSIMGLLPDLIARRPTGKVVYNGSNLLQLSEKEMRQIRGAKLSMIFQDPMGALNPVYPIGDQLLEVVDVHLCLSDEEALEKVINALKEVGIRDAEKRLWEYPHQLSGGMKQRVMIAMALLCEPDVLIADEPTTALDVTIQAQVLDLMRSLQEKRGTSILLITHDMGVVAEMADEVMVMYAAKVVERGDVFEVFDNLMHPYTQGLFNSRPHHKGKKRRLNAIPGTVPHAAAFPKGCRFHPRCSHVMDRCRKGKVKWFEEKKSGSHQAACWLYETPKS